MSYCPIIIVYAIIIAKMIVYVTHYEIKRM